MLKEITHEKAIEVLKSGGEIVVKRDSQLDLKYKMANNRLLWAIEDKWNNMPIKTLAEFLSNQIYIEKTPNKASMTFSRDQIQELTLLEIVRKACPVDFAEVSHGKFKIEISSEEFKEITAIKAIENAWGNKNAYFKVKEYDAIRKITDIDSLTVGGLNNYCWYELHKTTSTHESTYPSGFNLVVPTHILFGKEITITIEEVE
jgi:hypothetical protein